MKTISDLNVHVCHFQRVRAKEDRERATKPRFVQNESVKSVDLSFDHLRVSYGKK